MKLKTALLAASYMVAPAIAAFAADTVTTTPGTVVSMNPIVSWALPIVTTIVGAGLLWGGRILVSLAQKYVYSGINSNALDNITTAASAEAGKIIAASVDNLASKSITVGGNNAFVGMAVQNIMNHFAEDVAYLGFTPQRIEGLVIGELGKLQSNNPVPAVVLQSGVAAQGGIKPLT